MKKFIKITGWSFGIVAAIFTILSFFTNNEPIYKNIQFSSKIDKSPNNNSVNGSGNGSNNVIINGDNNTLNPVKSVAYNPLEKGNHSSEYPYIVEYEKFSRIIKNIKNVDKENIYQIGSDNLIYFEHLEPSDDDYIGYYWCVYNRISDVKKRYLRGLSPLVIKVKNIPCLNTYIIEVKKNKLLLLFLTQEGSGSYVRSYSQTWDGENFSELKESNLPSTPFFDIIDFDDNGEYELIEINRGSDTGEVHYSLGRFENDSFVRIKDKSILKHNINELSNYSLKEAFRARLDHNGLPTLSGVKQDTDNVEQNMFFKEPKENRLNILKVLAVKRSLAIESGKLD